LGGGVRTELEANLNAAGALERYWSDKLERCFSNNAPEASHDRRQPQSPSDYRQSSERGRARACVICPKTNRRDEKMAMRATQQPQRGGTTSCASRPSAGIDRAKCLISLATGEQETILSPVAAASSSAWPTGRGSGRWKSIPVPGPPACNFSLRFFLEMLRMLDRCERCGANLTLVGLRHRCVLRRYDAPPVTRPTDTETKRNAKDRTAAERMRRYRARERW
jgi:hypothetical protein